MIDLRALDRDHVLNAIDAYAAAGGDAFIAAHGAGDDGIRIMEAGRECDAVAVMGIAHGIATGRTLSKAELAGKVRQVHKRLVDLGFAVSPLPVTTTTKRPAARGSSAPRAAATPRTTSASRPATAKPLSAAAKRAAAEERPIALCPSCFVALPATGRCDMCD